MCLEWLFYLKASVKLLPRFMICTGNRQHKNMVPTQCIQILYNKYCNSMNRIRTCFISIHLIQSSPKYGMKSTSLINIQRLNFCSSIHNNKFIFLHNIKYWSFTYEDPSFMKNSFFQLTGVWQSSNVVRVGVGFL